jgi:ATP-dependent Clp protease ATP-binding subunit ClpC
LPGWSARGYVGYEDAGQLTEAIRRRPYSIVVFDEIEKAHPEAFNMLLQIMEEGTLTDARGRRVDFRNSIIVMTSNVGADLIRKGTTLGFNAPRSESADEKIAYEDMRKNVTDQLRRMFRPEFLNRVDATIVFRSLSRAEIKQIVDLEINKVRARLVEHAITLEVMEEAREPCREGIRSRIRRAPAAPPDSERDRRRALRWHPVGQVQGGKRRPRHRARGRSAA